jgi:hypothetical protein
MAGRPKPFTWAEVEVDDACYRLEADFTNNKPSARASLTDNSALSHRAHAWPDGRFSLGTSFGFGRPRRIRPIHCDGRSDRSRPTRTPD